MRVLRLAGVVLALSACSTGSPHAASTSTPSRTPLPAPPREPVVRAPATPTPAFAVRRVTATDLPHSWHPGCPVAPSQLRLLTLPYRDFDGVRRVGQLVVNARVAAQVAGVFRTLYVEGFPVRSMRPVDDFGGSDDRSMAADNTSGFNCRQAVGGSGWSQHAYGLAIDVNPRENPYLYGGHVLPPQGAVFVDRSGHQRGTAYRGSDLNRAFAREGWGWGGGWKNPDYQHFSSNGL